MNFKTLKDAKIKDQIALVRVDYNVPLEKGKITNDLRIRASLPTINYLLDHDIKQIVLISHLGRPEGKVNSELSLAPIARHLQKLLPDVKIDFHNLPKSGDQPLNKISNAKIVLLENLRFDPREEANDQSFMKEIIDFAKADFCVQDGFAVSHRAHASTSALSQLLPTYLGLLFEKEIQNLDQVLKNPTRPLLFIIGGAKVADKSPLIDKFLPLADKIAVGGKIAADGYAAKDNKIYIAEDFDVDSKGDKLDIGPISTAKICELIEGAKTVVWNGLLGKAEDPAYSTASTIVADLLGQSHDKTTIICGGDTTGFVENRLATHPEFEYSLISTGGGATLEYLLGNQLKIFTA